MSAYTPKLLRVDLSEGTVDQEVIPNEAVRDFIGGRGLGALYLYRELSSGVDPLGPENKLIIAIGPLAGTGVHSSSRWMAMCKSPLSEGYYRSVGGGDFGAWLRFAGLDLIIIQGQSTTPVYLYVYEGQYEIRDATDLWGKNTGETQQVLKEIHGDTIRAACIGPAGEKLVRYANIMSDRRAAGRGGVGAVMGSKNLKAIAINATPAIEISDDLKKIINEQIEVFRNSKMFQMYRGQGTAAADMGNRSGWYPTHNFQYGSLGGWENLSGKEFGKYKIRDTNCYTCIMRCGKIRTISSGPYVGLTTEGPEYETLWSFSGPTGCSNIEATMVADALCDDLGLDTISTGGCIGFAYELFEKDVFGLSETDGLTLNYGNHEAMIEMIERIAYRKGLGDLLAEGVKRAASHIGKGTEYYAIHIKGVELPGYDPRAVKRHGLGIATANAGGNHNLAWMGHELFGIPYHIDRYADSGNTDLLKNSQDEIAMFETGIYCLFASSGITPVPLFAKLLAAVTQVPELEDEQALLTVGERIYNLERAFNVREGFARQDDYFPPRIATEPITKAGPAEGQMIRQPELLLDEYYQFRGWNKDGVPTRKKFLELGLARIIDDT